MEKLSVSTIIIAVLGVLVLFAVLANFAKVQKFFLEVATELKKVSWSTRKELIDATWIVIVSSLFLGLFIGGTDFVLSKLLSILIG